MVSGATKNMTGHWKSHCYQANIRAYNLILTPGYSRSTCDCMICNILWDNFGPFMSRKEDLLKLDSNFVPWVMFTNFFMQLKMKNQHILLCPDLMFHTSEDEILPKRDVLLPFSKKLGIQAISFDNGPSKIEEFSCKDIGISCDIWTQAESYIIPWCCMKYANIIGNYQ